MAVISITISESELHKIAGVPASVTLTTNVPATIFFTLDGTDPTTSSSVVTGPIVLPTIGSVTLKAFATDGVNTSPIITQSYGTTTVGDRQPHDKISGITYLGQQGPLFGSLATDGLGIYDNIGGTTVDAPGVPGIPAGYDGTGTGTPSSQTDLPLADYDFIFSETNDIGERGKGIGTLPANATIVMPDPVEPLSVAKGSNNANSPFFNPRSLVIFQDSREEPYDPNVSQINHTFFSLENPERARNGALLFTSALDGNVPFGSALRSHFNPRENTITYYYRDQNTNRWIISKVPFSPKTPDMYNYSRIVFGRDKPTAKVFKWIPFQYRKLW
jgi:hypothetical protein